MNKPKSNRDLYEYLKLLRSIKIKPKKLRFVSNCGEIGISFLQLRNLNNQDVIKELLLDMQYTQLPCESAIGIASKVSKLPILNTLKLNFTDCSFLGNKGFQGVVIKLFRVTHLEEVSLIFNQCKIESTAIQHLVERMGQLTQLRKFTLGLRQNSLVDDNIAEIGKALNLCKKLEYIDLDLSYNSQLENPPPKSLDLSQLKNLKHFSISIQASKIRSPNFLELPHQLSSINLNFITINQFNYQSVLDTFNIISSIPLLQKINLMIHNSPFAFQQYGAVIQEEAEQMDEENNEQEEEEEEGEEGGEVEEENGEENQIEQEQEQNENNQEQEEQKEVELTEEQKRNKQIQDELFLQNICLEQIKISLTFKQSGVGDILKKLVTVKSLKSLYLKNRFGTALNAYDINHLRELIRSNLSLNSITLKFSQNQVTVQELNSILEDISASERWVHLNIDLSQTPNFAWENTLVTIGNQLLRLKNLESLSLNLSSNNIEGEDLVVFSQKLKLMQSLIALKFNIRGNTLSVYESQFICFNLRWLERLSKLKLKLGVMNFDEINEEGIVQTQTTIDESREYKKLMEFIKHREADITRIQLFDSYFRDEITFNPNILICDFYY